MRKTKKLMVRFCDDSRPPGAEEASYNGISFLPLPS